MTKVREEMCTRRTRTHYSYFCTPNTQAGRRVVAMACLQPLPSLNLPFASRVQPRAFFGLSCTHDRAPAKLLVSLPLPQQSTGVAVACSFIIPMLILTTLTITNLK